MKRSQIRPVLFMLLLTAPPAFSAIFNDDPRNSGCLITERNLDSDHLLGLCAGPGGQIMGLYFTEGEGDVRWLTPKALREAGLALTDKGVVARIDGLGALIPVKDEYTVLAETFRSHLESDLSIHEGPALADAVDRVSGDVAIGYPAANIFDSAR